MKKPEIVVLLLIILGVILEGSIIDAGGDERLGLFVAMVIIVGGGYLVTQNYEKNKQIKLHEEREKHDELFKKKNTQTIHVKPRVTHKTSSGEGFLYQGKGLYGLAHGLGKATTESGSHSYEGEFKNGEFHGYGYFVQKKDGKTFRFNGQFKNGDYDGYGVHIVTWKDSSGEYQEKTEGNWKNHKPNGQVRVEHYTGDVYIGELKDGLRNGKGTLIFKSKAEYTGEFKDGKRHGLGTDTYSNGDKYTGQFKDDKKHGLGTYIFSDGEKNFGEYSNGEFLG